MHARNLQDYRYVTRNLRPAQDRVATTWLGHPRRNPARYVCRASVLRLRSPLVVNSPTETERAWARARPVLAEEGTKRGLFLIAWRGIGVGSGRRGPPSGSSSDITGVASPFALLSKGLLSGSRIWSAAPALV